MLNKIKPLEDFLTGVRHFDPTSKIVNDDFVIHPIENFLSCANYTHAVLGDWRTVADLMTAAGYNALPVGSRVFGSDGKIYQVGAGSMGMTDPTKDTSGGWTNAGGSSNGVTPTTYTGSTPPSSTIVRVGDMWMTDQNTVAPYAKKTQYIWNGSEWQYLGGAAGVSFQIVQDAITSAAITKFDFTKADVTDNTLNVVMPNEKKTLPKGGTFDIAAYYLAKESWSGAVSTDYVGNRLILQCNGFDWAMNGQIEPAAVSDFDRWCSLNVCETVTTGDNTTIGVFIEKTKGNLDSGNWRVSVKQVG